MYSSHSRGLWIPGTSYSFTRFIEITMGTVCLICPSIGLLFLLGFEEWPMVPANYSLVQHNQRDS